LAITPKHTSSPTAIALAGLTGLAVSMGIGRFAFTPLLPMMQLDAGLSVSDGAWLASANYLGFLLGTLSAARLRMEPTAVVRTFLVVIGVVTIGMGLEHRFTGWIVLRVLAGLANAWAQIFTTAWALEKLASTRRPFFSGIVFGGPGVAIVVVGTYCVVLMQLNVSSAATWIGLGIVALIATAAIWPILQHNKLNHPLPPALSGRSIWNSESLTVILCFAASGVGYIIPATFLPVMARQFVSDPLIFGWAWPVFGVAAALAPVATADLTRITGNRLLWMASHLLMAFGVVLPLWWTSIAGIMASALIVGSTFMINGLASMQEAKAIAGTHATGLLAATTASFATGQILGPFAISLLGDDQAGFDLALVGAAALLVLSAFALARRPTTTAKFRPAAK
jgi:MFS family permease